MQSNGSFSLKTILTSIGQIMLQENPYTGLLFLIGIFYNSWIMGIGAVLAAVVGVLTATLLKYNQTEINEGLYGFSATLVGVALTFFFKPVLVIWVAIIIGATLATVIQHFFIHRKIPVFTLPFILITWVFLYLFHHVYVIDMSPAAAESIPFEDDFATVVHSFGEVIFQGSIISGVLFFLAVFISSPIGALYAVAGGLLSAYISLLYAEPATNIHMGLFSFNAVLCAITFSGSKARDGIFVLLAVVASTLIDVFMVKMGYTVLTFPFVAGCWITILVRKFLPESWKSL